MGRMVCRVVFRDDGTAPEVRNSLHACHRVAFICAPEVGCHMLSLTGTASDHRAELPGDEPFLARVELLAGG
jgi:hypothetical protein